MFILRQMEAQFALTAAAAWADELFVSENIQILERMIDRSANQILADLHRSFPNCRVPVVSIPVLMHQPREYANKLASDLPIPNPINGVHVNGHYFAPAQIVRGLPRERFLFHRHLMLEMEIERALTRFFPKGITFVDAEVYDRGEGGLHCATQTLSPPCSN